MSKTRNRYPAEAPVFKVVATSYFGAAYIGDVVEGSIGSVDGQLTFYSATDGWDTDPFTWNTRNSVETLAKLKPLTRAARAMLAIARSASR